MMQIEALKHLKMEKSNYKERGELTNVRDCQILQSAKMLRIHWYK